MNKNPYLTDKLPGIGGQIKVELEDFIVDEIPLYEPTGRGTHLYFRVEKQGLPTIEAVARIATHMGISPGQIGFAGMKDARAHTSQMMSLEHADAEKLAAFTDKKIKVTVLDKHVNKLKTGHLTGNHFTIRIRGVSESSLPQAQKTLDELIARGVPNYFGLQRFGLRGDTASLGEALLKNDLDTFISIFLGRPKSDDPADCRAARDAFDAGAYQRALSRWPRHYRDQRRALSAYKKKLHAGPAIAAIDRRLRRLFVSAFQSLVFNEVLAKRIESIDTVLLGDLAKKHDSGGVFLVEDASAEAPRAAANEISPTGPLPGYRCNLAEGQGGIIEREILDSHDLQLETIRKAGKLKVRGSRRPLRFFLTDTSLDADANGIMLSFSAPAGAYATVVLREIMKND